MRSSTRARLAARVRDARLVSVTPAKPELHRELSNRPEPRMNHKLISAWLIAAALPSVGMAGDPLNRDIIRRPQQPPQTQTPASSTGMSTTAKPPALPARAPAQRPVSSAVSAPEPPRTAGKQGDGSKVDNPTDMAQEQKPEYGPVLKVKPKG
jgi:hypothetical protein